MSDMDFTDKVVLVVGGSSGIGNGIAHAFRERGAEVHVWGTRPTAEDYRDSPGSDLQGLHYAQMDVSNFNAIESYIPEFDRLDVLVQCQGIVRYNREEFKTGPFRHVVDVNLTSLMACGDRFHDMLKESQGSMIIISSLAAYGARIGNPAYAASKAGAVSLTKTLGEAWARDGIRVNGVAPGLVPSKLTEVTTEDPERSRKVLRGIPAGRFGAPMDIAGPVLFLASPLAAYTIGQTIVADGGKGLS